MSPTALVAIIDDDPRAAALLRETVRDVRWESAIVTETFSGVDEFLAAVEGGRYFHVILSDVFMPGPEAGIRVWEWVKEKRAEENDWRNVQLRWLSSRSDVAGIIDDYAGRRHSSWFKFESYPFRRGEEAQFTERFAKAIIPQLLREALEASDASEYRRLVVDPSAPGFPSPAMTAAISAAQMIAPQNIHVLLVGETGVGKTELARYIHRSSPRSARPFKDVNVSSLTSTLIESELFGHERGAFTNASQRRVGLIADADDGTLFLDEIGELPLALQPILLHVLEGRPYRAVGGDRDRISKARIITATNRDLRAAVENGSFRKDLYYRARTFEISIPPLRDRPDDISWFARRALDLAAKEFDRGNLTLAPSLEAILRAAPWPGNLRELDSAIQATIATLPRRDTVIDETDLPGFVAADLDILPSRGALSDEIAALYRQLATHQWNQAAVAREMGVSRQEINRRVHADPWLRMQAEIEQQRRRVARRE